MSGAGGKVDATGNGSAQSSPGLSTRGSISPPTGLERDLKPISKCGRPTPLRSQSITPPQTVTTALTHGSREAQAVAFATAFTQA